MSKTMKSIENNMAKDNDNSETLVKKTKQLTLFDMKGKGKFNIPDSYKKEPLNESLNKSLNKSLNESLNTSTTEASNENKKSKTKNNSSTKKALNKSITEIETVDTLTDNLNQIDIMIEEVEKKPKLNSKIMDYFSSADKNSSKAPKRSPKRKVPLKEKLTQFGRLALAKSPSENEMETDTETYEFKNEMFGDIAIVLEIYNSFVPLFKTRKNSKLHKVKIEVNRIDFNEFVGIIKFDTIDAKKSYVKLVKNLLNILLKRDDSFDFITLFEKPIASYLDNKNIALIQELCRIVATSIFYEMNVKSNANREKVFFASDSEFYKYELVNKLKINQAEEPFESLDMKLRIELLKVFCEQILTSELYQTEKEKIEETISQSKKNIHHYETELCTLLNINYKDAFLGNRAKYYKEAETSTSRAVKNVFAEIESNKNNLEKNKNLLKKFERIEPMGVDKSGNSYWYFSFFKGVVVECKTREEDVPNWLLFETETELNGLMSALKEEENKIHESLKPIVAELEEQAKEAKEANEKKNKNNKSQAEYTSDEDASKRKSASSINLEMFERRVTRHSLRGPPEVEEIKKPEVETKKEKSSKDTDEDLHFEWLEWDDDDIDYSVNRLCLYLVNSIRVAHFYALGLHDKERFEKMEALIKSYSSLAKFEDKLSATKNVLLELYNSIVINNRISEFDFKFKSITRPSGKCDIWADYVASTNSLSALYFMTYVLMLNIKWNRSVEDKRCKVCNKIGKKLYPIETFEEFKTDEFDYGFTKCVHCFLPIHLKCMSSDMTVQNNGNIICETCSAPAKPGYEYVEEVEEKNKKEPEEVESDSEENGSVRSARLRPRAKRSNQKKKYVESIDDDDESTQSSSQSSVQSSNSEKSTNTRRGPKRGAAVAASKNAEKSSNTRSSARLRNTNTSNKNYVFESSEEDED